MLTCLSAVAEVEGESRHRLSLNAHSDLLPMIPSLFSRFDAVTKLTLKCDRRSVSVGDDALVFISLRCQNLTRLKLCACRELTNAGMVAFAKNCKGLKKLSCGSCTFGAKGMNAVLNNCSSLKELSVKRLRGITGFSSLPITKSQNPKRVIQLRPPINPYSLKPVGEDQDDDELPNPNPKKHFRGELTSSFSTSIKSLLSSLPPPKNALSLGSGAAAHLRP